MLKTLDTDESGEIDEEEWVEVEAEDGSGTYWWNTETDETTQVGAPHPLEEQQPPSVPARLAQGNGTSLGTMLLLGAGFGGAAALIGKVIS